LIATPTSVTYLVTGCNLLHYMAPEHWSEHDLNYRGARIRTGEEDG